MINFFHIEKVCGKKSNGRCRKEYFADVAQELERRHFLSESTKWDFQALNVNGTGRISIESALFLTKAVHGDKFSLQNWKLFLSNRLNPFNDVSYSEMELFLCQIPEFASSNADEEYAKQEGLLKQQAREEDYKLYEELERLQV